MTTLQTSERHSDRVVQTSGALGINFSEGGHGPLGVHAGSADLGEPDFRNDQSGIATHAGTVITEQVSDRGHALSDAPSWTASVGADVPGDQTTTATQAERVAGHSDSSEEGHGSIDNQSTSALLGAELEQGEDAKGGPIPTLPSRPPLFDPVLASEAQFLNDLEGLRKANNNRLRIITKPVDEPDEDGKCRGLGYDPMDPGVLRLMGLGEQLDELEHGAILALQWAMRGHPLSAWQKQARGVGEKQLARLLAVIGDPYLRFMPDGSMQPRTVSQLWSYCGLRTVSSGQRDVDAQRKLAAGTNSQGGAIEVPVLMGEPLLSEYNVAVRRAKGQKANWSTEAKTRAYLIATSIVKTKGEYRDVYDARRAHTAERVHMAPCQVCAGAGKKAELVIGQPWKDGHKHADALRIVAKRVLRDLWRAARDYHEGNG